MGVHWFTWFTLSDHAAGFKGKKIEKRKLMDIKKYSSERGDFIITAEYTVSKKYLN